jgi:AAA15 family ATPase/GTPase
MINYIKLRNYKNFGNITLDLRGKNGHPKKIAFIYGENGAGKTNLLSSLLFFTQSTITLQIQSQMLEFRKQFSENKENIDDKPMKLLFDLARHNFLDLSSLVKNAWMIGNQDNMVIEIGFNISGHDGVYYSEFNQEGIIEEKLTYLLKERSGTLFHIGGTEKTKIFNEAAFLDKSYVKELNKLVDQYWGKHSFLAILREELTLKQKEYLAKGLSHSVHEVLNFILSLSVTNLNSTGNFEMFQRKTDILDPKQQIKGIIKKEDKNILTAYAVLLNSYLTSMISDIKSVQYDIEERNGQLQYKLIINKMINGKIRKIPAVSESSGIIRLLHFFPYILNCISGRVVFIDELDNGIHDLMMTEFIQTLNSSLTGQLIASTHNTTMLKDLPPENVYVIVMDAKGVAKVLPLTAFGERIQGNNNVTKKYLEGCYGGIPYVGDLDFDEIADELKIYDANYIKTHTAHKNGGAK